MLEVRLRHHFAGFDIDIAFTAPTPGVTVLFGPSGAGKSTIVAALAGLLRPDHGAITIDGAPLLNTATRLNLPPEHRRLGLVFQEARLFPHLSVESNLRYGLRRAPPGPIAFADIIDLLGIAPLLPRRPHTLSGGERQRVAIGRALLSQPRLLLMDEPLANLDAARKSEILPYLLRLKTALSLPIVYVTHAPDEVFAIADTLVLLDRGRVQAAGPLTDLTARGDLPLAARDDAGAVLPATILEHHPTRRLSLLASGDMRLWVPLVDAPTGTALRLRIPAREIILATTAPDGISLHNIVPAHVRAVTEDPTRHAALVELNTGGAVLLARITPDAVARLQLSPGAAVLALIKSMAVDVLPR